MSIKSKTQTKQVAVDAELMKKLRILGANHDMKIKDMINDAIVDYILTFEGAEK